MRFSFKSRFSHFHQDFTFLLSCKYKGNLDAKWIFDGCLHVYAYNFLRVLYCNHYFHRQILEGVQFCIHPSYCDKCHYENAEHNLNQYFLIFIFSNQLKMLIE